MKKLELVSGLDLAGGPDKTVLAVSQRSGVSPACDLPRDFPKIVAATVFQGELYLATADGLYIVQDGKPVRMVMVLDGPRDD